MSEINHTKTIKNASLSDRFKYWLDKKMAKGTMSIIVLLTLAVLSVIVFVSVLAILFKLRDSIFPAFWDSLANTINTEMPSSEDGGIGYIVLNTLTALAGLLFTSILIGVVSSGIEEKLNDLRKGNSLVLENRHTVILGYNIGEHGLLKQLILATEKDKRCIVICTDIEKPDLEQDLQNNVEIPDNIEVICRNGDITNTNDLRCCSIEKADVIVINALDDNRRIKTILAVLCIKKEYPEFRGRIVACVTDEKHMLPQNKIDKKNIIMLKTDDIMARIIAHTSTEPGLSIAFKELLNFEENEFYFEKDYRLIGKTVMDITKCLNKASIVGIRRDEKTILNPDKNMTVEIGDDLVFFEENKGSFVITEDNEKNVSDRELPKIRTEAKGTVLIIGSNVMLGTILKELPNEVDKITVVSQDEETVNRLIRKNKVKNIELYEGDYEEDLKELAAAADHIVILIDRNIEKEDADINNILLLLKLMNYKELYGYGYNITVELNMENSYNVSLKNNKIDYIVGSNIASLLLAQISENPNLEEILNELLSKKGNELYSKSIHLFNLKTEHDYSYNGLKQIVLSYGYTLLGYSNRGAIILNPDSEERVLFDENDRLFVLGEN
ncbi:MAG: hypothetical protein J5365_08145 [Erysipelotrichaceae bacterium]|nr:hypothetical protein [Erysipelotrichaceae bacterium]